MAFAKIIARLSFKTPYINHMTTPIKNMISIGKDKLETSFVFQVLYTCGKNDAVVKNAAIKPMISM